MARYNYRNTVFVDIDKVRQCANEKKISIVKLSAKMGFDPSYVGKILNQRQGRMPIVTYNLLCDALGVNKDDLARDIRIVDYSSIKAKINQLQANTGTYQDCLHDIFEVLNEEM